MFLSFLDALRRSGVPVGTQEWLAFLRALEAGLDGGNLKGFYLLGRSILIHSESHYDAYDVAFAQSFSGLELPGNLKAALKAWLKAQSIQSQGEGDGNALIEALQDALELENQQGEEGKGKGKGKGQGQQGDSKGEGQGDVGGGGNRQAIFAAESRNFRAYSEDITLNVRQFSSALRELRALKREGPVSLDVDRTIKKTADAGGEIDFVFTPDRKNSLKVLLLMDVGGSMEPYRTVVSRLFSAAHKAQHFKQFEYRYFHNAPYARLYRDPAQWDAHPTEELLKKLSPDFRVVFVGDACMAPWELGNMMVYGNSTRKHLSGLDWIKRISRNFADAVWLNPEPISYWNHPTIRSIGRVVPMYPLTLRGLRGAVKQLRAGRPHPLST